MLFVEIFNFHDKITCGVQSYSFKHLEKCDIKKVKYLVFNISKYFSNNRTKFSIKFHICYDILNTTTTLLSFFEL